MRVRNLWAPDPFLTVVITFAGRQRIALARKQIRQAFAEPLESDSEATVATPVRALGFDDRRVVTVLDADVARGVDDSSSHGRWFLSG
jgi:hypothetical protein